MSQRTFLQLGFTVGRRNVTVRAMDAIGPEDTLNVSLAAAIHRQVTGEDLWTPVPREIKDFMIRTNLTI